ncbi:MAG: DUF3106 domain-containing protein [Luteimonas sp.]
MRRSLATIAMAAGVLIGAPLVGMFGAGMARAQSLPPALLERAQVMRGPTRADLERHAAQLSAMTPAQREAFAQRAAQWDALVPARQRELRETWQEWQALPASERARVQAAASMYAGLPADQQRALRTQYDALDGSERRGWLLGPELGADYPKLHALFAQVPQAQREDLLAALRVMSPSARTDLSVLAQRTPPQGRDELRTQLLAVPATQRGAWLRARLDR